MSQTTIDPLARWEEILPLVDRSRSGLVDPAGEFLRALASFVILHQADVEEAEREAIASFDDQDYPRRFQRSPLVSNCDGSAQCAGADRRARLGRTQFE